MTDLYDCFKDGNWEEVEIRLNTASKHELSYTDDVSYHPDILPFLQYTNGYSKQLI